MVYRVLYRIGSHKIANHFNETTLCLTPVRIRLKTDLFRLLLALFAVRVDSESFKYSRDELLPLP